MPESGGVGDFLFETNPPQSVTTYGQTVEGIPKWLSDYTQGLLGRANAIAGEPYQPYGGPRIAGFDPYQEQAFGMAGQAATAYQPYLHQAAGQIQGALGQTFPGNVQQYMDPYIGNVLDRQEELSRRTLTEEFLPELQNAFIGAGQFGSDRMEEMGLRGVRDISENLESQRLASLSGAYGQAADIFGADIGRQFEGAGQIGALGASAQQLGFQGAAGLEAIGAQRRSMPQGSLDLAYADFLRQQGYPADQARFMSEMIRGLPSQGRTISQQDYGPASIYQPSGIAQLASGIGVAGGINELMGGGEDHHHRVGGLARVSGYKRKQKSPQLHLEYYNG
jgi:hypothetical protein